jgi:hypothetical protein
MERMDPTGILAKAEVKRAIGKMRKALRGALPVGEFWEREAAALAVSNETVRGAVAGGTASDRGWFREAGAG